MAPQNPHLCDTLPQAKLAQTTATRSPSHDQAQTSLALQSERPLTSENIRADPPGDLRRIPSSPQRKLCPRHKRMADEGTNLKLQQVRDSKMANSCVGIDTPPRLWIPSLWRSEKQSTLSGRISRPHLILGVL